MQQGFLLLSTVMVEAEWVLRSVYRWSRADIFHAFAQIMDMPEARGFSPGICWALGRFAEGGDFADMVHVSLARDADALLTFDKRVETAAVVTSPVRIKTLGID